MIDAGKVVPNKKTRALAFVDIVFDDDVGVVFLEDQIPRKEVIEPIEETVGTVKFPFVKLLLYGLFHKLNSLLMLGKL